MQESILHLEILYAEESATSSYCIRNLNHEQNESLIHSLYLFPTKVHRYNVEIGSIF